MSKFYVLAYLDDQGVERVAPKELKVSYQDKVIWCNNLPDNYSARNFKYMGPGVDPGKPFPDGSYGMPPNGQSNGATVQISQNGSFTFSYDCTDGTTPLDPVIIVDNPGTGDGDGPQAAKPRRKGRKPAPKSKAKPKRKKVAGKKPKSGKRR